MLIFKPIFYKPKNILNILILLIVFIKVIISANECNDCEVINYKCKKKNDTDNCNEDKCKPHLYNNNKCYYCSYNDGTTGEGTGKKINIYSIEEEECTALDYCNKKRIVIETSECVEDDCGSGYILETTFENEVYERCIESCPSGYFAKDGKCVVKCDPDDLIREGRICTDSCNNTEFLVTKEEKMDGKNILRKYCVSKCPDEARYFYDDILHDKKCIEKCNKNDFYLINNECISRSTCEETKK